MWQARLRGLERHGMRKGADVFFCKILLMELGDKRVSGNVLE